MYVFSQRKTLLQHPTARRKPPGFGCVYAGHFHHVPTCASACSVSTISYPGGLPPQPGYIHEKTHTHLFFQDMYGVFRLMFLPNRPSARAKSKIFSAGYIITRNLSCKVFLSLPAFCSYSHTKIPCQGISYHRRRFRRERQPIRTLQSYLILLFS